jgi:hypothetical protein
MRKVQRDALLLNDLPSTIGLTQELRELMVYFEALHGHPNTYISSYILLALPTKIDLIGVRIIRGRNYRARRLAEDRNIILFWSRLRYYVMAAFPPLHSFTLLPDVRRYLSVAVEIFPQKPG